MGPWAIISKDIYILCIFIFLSPVEATASMNFCRSATTQISTICLVAVFQRPKYGNQFKEGIKYKDVLVVKKKGKKKREKKKKGLFSCSDYTDTKHKCFKFNIYFIFLFLTR